MASSSGQRSVPYISNATRPSAHQGINPAIQHKKPSISQDFWGPMIIFVDGGSYARMTSLVPSCMWPLKKFPGLLIDTIGGLFLFSCDVLVEVDMQYVWEWLIGPSVNLIAHYEMFLLSTVWWTLIFLFSWKLVGWFGACVIQVG